jgi:predicted DNA-binding transcriptional regulator AlpA
VCDLLGVSASTLARLEASGEFPGRTKISERRYGWRDSVISDFIRARST